MPTSRVLSALSLSLSLQAQTFPQSSTRPTTQKIKIPAISASPKKQNTEKKMPISHHCPICENGVFKQSCLKKDHMWYCASHESWIRRDWPCVSCVNASQASGRRRRHEERRMESNSMRSPPRRSKKTSKAKVSAAKRSENRYMRYQ